MAKTTTTMESVELNGGGELGIYINVNAMTIAKASLTFSNRTIESNVWVTLEEAKEYADKILKALSEVQ